MLAVTKSDLLDNDLKKELSKDLPDIPTVFISSVAQQGLQELKDILWMEINR